MVWVTKNNLYFHLKKNFRILPLGKFTMKYVSLTKTNSSCSFKVLATDCKLNRVEIDAKKTP